MNFLKAALSFAILTLLAGCAAPERRYPEFVVNAPQKQITDGIASTFEAQSQVERKAADEATRLHSVLSNQNGEVVIKSLNANYFRRPGFIKIYYATTPISESVTRVKMRLTYVQNAETSFAREVDIYDAGEVQGPQTFVANYETIFQRWIPFIEAGAAQPRTATAIRKVQLDWAGVGANITGTLNIAQTGNNSVIAVTLPNQTGTCLGTALTDGASPTGTWSGTWSVACPNKLAASGTFKDLAPNRTATGEGVDNQGRKINLSIPVN